MQYTLGVTFANVVLALSCARGVSFAKLHRVYKLYKVKFAGAKNDSSYAGDGVVCIWDIHSGRSGGVAPRMGIPFILCDWDEVV